MTVKVTPTSFQPTGYLSFEHALAYLDLPAGTLREHIRLRRIPCFKVGRRVQFKVKELDVWMEQRRLRKVAISCAS